MRIPFKKLYVIGATAIGVLFVVLWPAVSTDGTPTLRLVEKLEIILLGLAGLVWLIAALRFLASRSSRAFLDAVMPVTLSALATAALVLELRGTGLQGEMRMVAVMGLVVLAVILAFLTSLWWRAGPKRWDTVAEALSAPTSVYVMLGCAVVFVSQIVETVIGYGSFSQWLKEVLEIEGLYTFIFAAFVAHATLRARLA